MAKEVPWSRFLLDRFIEDMDGIMTDEEEQILRLHVAKYSNLAISQKMHCSISTVDRAIALLKRMYDRAQSTDPVLPPRKKGGGLKT